MGIPSPAPRPELPGGAGLMSARPGCVCRHPGLTLQPYSEVTFRSGGSKTPTLKGYPECECLRSLSLPYLAMLFEVLGLDRTHPEGEVAGAPPPPQSHSLLSFGGSWSIYSAQEGADRALVSVSLLRAKKFCWRVRCLGAGGGACGGRCSPLTKEGKENFICNPSKS